MAVVAKLNSAPGLAAGHEPWRLNLGQSSRALTGPRGADWWTGLNPQSLACPGRGADGAVHALPQINMATCTRQEVQDYFANGWLLTELLFASLQGEEAFYRPPYHALRHPLLFYYVHPAVLYVNKLALAKLAESSLNRKFEALFETGVDEMRWDDMSKNAMLWPSIDLAHQYRQQVFHLVSQLIETHPDLADGHAPITMEHPLWALFMGFEHERIHLETSSVLLRELPLSLLLRPAQFPLLHPSAQTQTTLQPATPGFPAPLLAVAGGPVRLGKAHAVPYFGWDNEYGERVVEVAPFAVQAALVSNGDFFRFVVDGGYREAAHWSEEGWNWRAFRNTKAPSFWVLDGPQGTHAYRLRTLFEEIPMRWEWPAILNCHEAEAYAKWLSVQSPGAPYRLISEAEHRRLLGEAPSSLLPLAHGANFNLQWSSESPVTFGADAAAGGVGNVWQWCLDDFNALPGFRIHDYYDDFSTPCFDGEHRMILGGSFMSAGGEAAPWARYHFRPHFVQHAGARLVRAEAANAGGAVRLKREETTASTYESEQLFNEYMLLHYGAPADVMPHAFGPQDWAEFPQRCARLGMTWSVKLGLKLERALDVGCAVGGAAFTLAAGGTQEVIGIDLSERFIAAAQELQAKGKLRYFRKDQGELGTWLTAEVADAAARACCSFQRGDACALPPDLGAFDLVLLANLLCRVPSPRSCLRRMGGEHGLVRPGGLLVLTNPFSWAEVYAPKEAWLGARKVGEQEVRSEDALKEALADDFELLEQTTLPLVIREHERKFQFIVPATFVFRRKA